MHCSRRSAIWWSRLLIHSPVEPIGILGLDFALQSMGLLLKARTSRWNVNMVQLNLHCTFQNSSFTEFTRQQRKHRGVNNNGDKEGTQLSLLRVAKEGV